VGDKRWRIKEEETRRKRRIRVQNRRMGKKGREREGGRENGDNGVEEEKQTTHECPFCNKTGCCYLKIRLSSVQNRLHEMCPARYVLVLWMSIAS
jgi:hypothetical protein